MRTDVRIDRKQVKLPNSTNLGFGKWKAQFGDVVRFDESGHDMYGRIIGRIAHAHRPDGDPDVRGWLVVIALGSNLSFPMERWVNPADVRECFNPQAFGGRDMAKFLAFFFGPEFRKQKTEVLRAWSTYGQPDFEKYMNRDKS